MIARELTDEDPGKWAKMIKIDIVEVVNNMLRSKRLHKVNEKERLGLDL